MWIIISMAAMLANVLKMLIVKHSCQSIDSRLLVLASRLTSTLILLPLLIIQTRQFPLNPIFWTVIALTATLTAAASLLLTEAVKKGPLTLVIPIQSAVPICSLLALILFFHQRPRALSIAFMLISMACVCLMLYWQKKSDSAGPVRLRYILFSALAAVIFGFSTVMDPVAIRQVAHGALAYSGCWNLASTLIMAVTLVRGPRLPLHVFTRRHRQIALYSLTTLAAFFLQQYAVQLSLNVPGAVVNVKTLVMLHLPIVALAGALFYREKTPLPALLAGLAAIISGILLIRNIL